MKWASEISQTESCSEAIDAGSHAGGAKAVVNVDDGDVGGAAVQHGEERRHSTKTGAVADTRGHGDDRHGNQSADDTRERALHPGYADDDARSGELRAVL